MSDYGRGRCIILYMDRQSAYTELLHRHRSLVWRMCWFAAKGNWARCCDMVQEVSIAMWIHFDTLRVNATPGEVRSWVYWQCRSSLDLQRRHQGPLQQPLTALMEETLVADDLTSQNEEIERLMSVLSTDDKRLVRMHLEGYRADEIAEVMSLSRDAVYQRLHRAVGKMRRVALMLVLLCLVATVAVAVVPQWRRWIISHIVEEKPQEVPLMPSESHSPTPQTPPETVPDTVVRYPVRVRQQAIARISAVADTLSVMLPQGLDAPCGCGDTTTVTIQRCFEELAEEDTVSSAEELPPVTVIVNGNNVIVEGAADEQVSVFDAQDRLVATTQCTGRCTLIVNMENNPNTTGSGNYWVQVGNRPRQRVFLSNNAANRPFNSLIRPLYRNPASPY